MLAASCAAVSNYDLLGFMVSDITLGAPKPDKNTQAAIDSRIKASQETEKKNIELENEKIEAEKKHVVAEGEAKKKLIEAEAKANNIVAQSLHRNCFKKSRQKPVNSMAG